MSKKNKAQNRSKPKQQLDTIIQNKGLLEKAENERQLSPDLGLQPASEDHTKMRFSEDKYYTDLNEPLYRKGIVYDVPNNKVERWIKRGGVIIDCQETLEQVQEEEKLQEEAKQALEAEQKKAEDQGESKFIDPDRKDDDDDEGYF